METLPPHRDLPRLPAADYEEEYDMKTTKFGLSISLFAAIVYFSALQVPIVSVLMLGYALLVEKTEEMRKMTCQAITVLGAVWCLTGVYSILTQIVNLLNTFVGSGYLHMPYGLSIAVNLILDAVVMLFGVLALLGGYGAFSLPVVNQAAQRMQPNPPAQPQPMQPQHPVQPQQPMQPARPQQPAQPNPQAQPNRPAQPYQYTQPNWNAKNEGPKQ